jgi:hypothetical protein
MGVGVTARGDLIVIHPFAPARTIPRRSVAAVGLRSEELGADRWSGVQIRTADGVSHDFRLVDGDAFLEEWRSRDPDVWRGDVATLNSEGPAAEGRPKPRGPTE